MAMESSEGQSKKYNTKWAAVYKTTAHFYNAPTITSDYP